MTGMAVVRAPSGGGGGEGVGARGSMAPLPLCVNPSVRSQYKIFFCIENFFPSPAASFNKARSGIEACNHPSAFLLPPSFLFFFYKLSSNPSSIGKQ